MALPPYPEPTPHQETPASVILGPDETMIVLSGQIDFDAADDLESAAHEAIRRGKPVVIDLTSVAFMDSTGLDMIAEIASAEAETGRRLLLVGTPRIVLELLRATGLDDSVTMSVN